MASWINYLKLMKYLAKGKSVKSNNHMYKYKLRNSWLIRSSGVILDHKLVKESVTKKGK